MLKHVQREAPGYQFNRSIKMALSKFGFTYTCKAKSNADIPINDGTESGVMNEKKAVITTANRKFQTRWLTDFRWLIFEGKSMKCRMCVEAHNGNTFALTGSTNFQRSALERHQVSDDHKLAECKTVQAKLLKTTVNEQCEKVKPRVRAEMSTVATMVGWDIPDRKYEALIKMQIENQCEAFKTAGCTSSSTSSSKASSYTSNYSYKILENALSDAADEEIQRLIDGSDFIGIMVDESIDVAINKKLILYLKVIDNGKSKIVFGGNVTVKDGTADTITTAILEFVTEKKIPLKKLIGFASDGASVMVGRLNGVTTQLKKINAWIISVHCAAHRLALAAFHGAKTIKYLAAFQDTITCVFKFFKYSATRYQKIRELKSVLGCKVKKFKKPSSVRWLSIGEAVDAIHGSWNVLVMTLENEYEMNKTPEAKGILKTVNTYKFLATSALLVDVLSVINKLSKVFQKDNIDIQQLQDMLQTCKATLQCYMNDDSGEACATLHETLTHIRDSAGSFHGVEVKQINPTAKQEFVNLKKKYLKNVIEKIDERFDEVHLSMLVSMNKLLNPKLLPMSQASILHYGKDDLESIKEHYGKSITISGTVTPPIIDSERITNDFLQFKFLLNSKRHFTLSDFLQQLILFHSEDFPDFSCLAKLLCAIPLTSVPCERGFSLQNRMRNTTRNRLNCDRVEKKMKIHYVLKHIVDNGMPEHVCVGRKRNLIDNATNKVIKKRKV